jgi:hypothetical protein
MGKRRVRTAPAAFKAARWGPARQVGGAAPIAARPRCVQEACVPTTSRQGRDGTLTGRPGATVQGLI